MTYPLVSLIISLVFDYLVLALIDGLQQQLRHQHQLVQEKDSESYRNFINSLNSNMTRKTATMATGRRCTGRGCQPVSDFTQCDQWVLSLPVLWAKLVAHQLVGLSAEERGDRPSIRDLVKGVASETVSARAAGSCPNTALATSSFDIWIS